MMVPKLSLCITTFNRPLCLDQALASIARNLKGGEPIEIVVSDNNGSDQTSGVIERWRKSLPLVYYRNPVNIGADKNVAQSVSLACGEYVWLFSDDDIVIDEAIRYLLDFLSAHHDIGYIFYSRVLVDENLNPITNKPQPDGLSADQIFSDGYSLFTSNGGQISTVIGFLSSTVIKRKLFLENLGEPCTVGVGSTNDWAHFRVILKAIRTEKCAILAKTGIFCRLQPTPFNLNSAIWFDDYIRSFLSMIKLGYSRELCMMTIKKIIRAHSKSFVVDKARGLRNDNIFSYLSKLQCSQFAPAARQWLILSFLPSSVLNVALKAVMFSRRCL